ncbi:hypothetical protein [Neotabrizicola sp. VNH66]|uniref:hypothetical protein n=1 Tax=Neotabrizicola sp. VNH66 TaxID=3400918 RepID=UPI003C122F5D
MRAILALLLAAVAAPASAEMTEGPTSYPFIGRWDCEVGEFSFSATTYDPGEAPMEILDVAQDGQTYTLTFADDYQLSLGMNPDGTMAWFSPVSGDSFTCRPLD